MANTLGADSVDFAETLKRNGVPEDLQLPLDATITARTLVRNRSEPEPQPRTWESSLPYISVAPISPGAETEHGATPPELQLTKLVGEGGMGQVFLARQRSLQRDIAVKTVRPGSGQVAVDALCTEAVITGNLEHPGIVPMHALARSESGEPLLLMKRVEGESWRALLADPSHPAWERHAPKPEERLDWNLGVLAQVCNAVAFAHSQRFVHRDLKPENVMVGEFGEVYVVDWGLAVRAGEASEGGLVGTPAYMAPEMVAGGPVDERTDVYLLGATLHEILTGKPPHAGRTLHEALQVAYRSEPKQLGPELPVELASLCLRAMKRDASERLESAAQFRRELLEYQKHRASRALSRAAGERLAELEAQLERPGAERDPAAIQRALWECRFGFAEARREWSENPEVAPGLQACLEAAIALELQRRDPVAARAFLRELPQANPALERSILALEAELARAAEENLRLQSLARDLDTTVDARLRGLVLIVGTITTGGVTFFALARDQSSALTAPDLVLFAAATFCFGLLILGTFGRKLLSQGYNRRLMLWIGSAMLTFFVGRLVGLLGGTPVSQIFAHDQALMAASWTAGGIYIERRLFIGGVALLLGAVATSVWPAHAPTIFSISSGIGVVTAVRAWMVGKREGR